MRKQTNIYFDTDKLQRLDQYVVLPCSRSDLLNDMLDYFLVNDYVIKDFVSRKNNEFKTKAMSSITQ